MIRDFARRYHLYAGYEDIPRKTASMVVHIASCNTLLQTVVEENKRGRVRKWAREKSL